MKEPRRFPYGGVPVYNPQSLSRTEAIAQFHARQAAYLSLMDLLREERPSHGLIIGTRGMGKTPTGALWGGRGPRVEQPLSGASLP
jgi:hypothetical protein